MTKETFTKVFETIANNIKTEVNGELCMNYWCELNNNQMVGYSLKIKPNVILWDRETELINSIARINSALVIYNMYKGEIEIY